MTNSTESSPTPSLPVDASVQVFSTDGLDVRERRGLFVNTLTEVIKFAERMNLRYSEVSNPPVHKNSVFPWAAEVEREWGLIRYELESVLRRRD
jgi:beta-hydroxylase